MTELEDLAFRLGRYVRPGRGCWRWTAMTLPDGYGMIWFRTKMIGAHRARWILEHGAIPIGMVVCHRCDNPPCTNPKHLFLGTRADNNRDRMRKGRSALGEKSGRAKLTEEQVREIRRTYTPYKVTCKMLAKKFGVTWEHIHRVVMGQSWRHL